MDQSNENPATPAPEPDLQRGLLADAAPYALPFAVVAFDHALDAIANRPPPDEPPPTPKVILPPGVSADDE